MRAASISLPPMTISVRSTATVQVGTDPQLVEIGRQAEAAGEPIQVRVSPQLYRFEGRAYTGWGGTSFTVGVPDVQTAEQFKLALQEFFSAVATGKLEELATGLRQFRDEVQQ